MTESQDEISAEVMDQIMDCIYQGKKIEAIKLYIDTRSVRLKEGKDFIETLTAELREQHPEKFQVPHRAGCMGVLIFLAGSVAFVAYSCG